MLEVEGKELTFYTLTQKFTVKGSLKQIKERLPEPNFIQVSRYSLINIEYLLAIENSFSGTMVAKLTNDLKTSVSRKYVPAIKEYLGL
ncbi:LytTR family DNA-binding domain-containing protein [Ligilactobacillus faecis]|uniref:LytTR family DNA-binding domain-containing protein n=1 Tax=Ligilactobacillus faecis TaxID=762833 RepID=UPI002469613D|nr:LytTR family DNA-binding domain-containing protein [Ligilactobacillus faecis]WGN90320.1 LytTR family DNA-binding domain-containing protein [Ligilactobacillus faecis]